MRRILLALAVVFALGLFAVPAMAGEVRYERDHRVVVVKDEHRDVRTVVVHREPVRRVIVRHDRVIREVHRR